MHLKIILISLVFLLFIHPVKGIGLHIRNESRQPVTARIITANRENVKPLSPNESYFFSAVPIHMTVYGPDGSCSQFNAIAMNGSIFDYLLIRNQAGARGCFSVGFAGKSRQNSPQIIPPVAFDPNACIRRCWNPNTGMVQLQSGRNIAPGYVPQKVVRAGTYTPTSIAGSV